MDVDVAVAAAAAGVVDMTSNDVLKVNSIIMPQIIVKECSLTSGFVNTVCRRDIRPRVVNFVSFKLIQS